MLMMKHIDKWNINLGKLKWKKPCFMKIPIDLPSFPSLPRRGRKGRLYHLDIILGTAVKFRGNFNDNLNITL
jgi:hypothetical protein